MKRCTKCLVEKDEGAFFRASHLKSGLRPDCKVCHGAVNAQHHAANVEKIKARKLVWLAANPDYMHRYKQANPNRVAAYGATRRARKRCAEGSYSAEDVERIHAAQRYRCAVCGVSTRKAKQVDHIVSLARGGSNWPSNLQILCPRCNRQKHDADPIDFMNSRGLLL